MHRYRLRTLFLAMAVVALALAVATQVDWRAAEDRVFGSVKIGETEQHLIDLFDENGIHYSTDDHNPTRIVYSHSDGFMGICIYYVEKGRVTVAVKD